MTKKLSCLAFCVLALAALSAAQDNKSKDEHRTVTQVLDRTVSNVEHEFVPAAEAMPEDKFGFAPTNGEFKGVRTFAQQIKHVAAVNYELGAAILEEKPPVDIGDESGPASITTKADILKYLNDSFAYVHKAVQTINEKNLVEASQKPVGRRNSNASQSGHERGVARVRPLRTDGGVSAHEWDRTAGQPVD